MKSKKESNRLVDFCLPIMIFVLAFMFFAPVSSYCQITTGSVSGVVTNEQGSVIQAATVIAQQAGTINTLTSTTDEKGRYSFPNLSPGVYKIVVDAEGFNPLVQEDVTVSLGAKIRLSFQLQKLPDIKKEIIVTAAAPPVETTKTSVDTNVNFEQFKDVPTQGRDFNSVINLVPGVTKFGPNFNVGGSRDNQNNYLVDGMKNNELGDTSSVWLGGYVRSLYGYAQPNQEPEQYVQSNPGSALQQYNLDSIEEVQISKAGYSSEFGQGSGGVFNVVTRSGSDSWKYGLTVNTQTDKLTPAAKRAYPLKQWQESLFLGGPLIKGKLRFFLSVERDDYYVGFDDRTVSEANLNLWVKDLNVWRSEQGVSRVTGKFTFIQTERNKFNLTANYFNDAAIYRNTQWRAPGNIEERKGTNKGFSLMLNNQRQFKDGLLQISAKYSLVDRLTTSPPGPVGGNNVELRPEGPGFDFWIRRTGSQGPDTNARINSFQLKPTYNWFLKDKAGDHNLLFGVDYENYRQRTTVPEWSYIALANMLNGEVPPFQIIPPDQNIWYLWFVQTYAGLTYKLPLSQAAAFVNDDWTVGKRLTLNLGLRLDWDEFIKKTFLSPRFGFAIDPINDGKTVIRGGLGVFRDRSDLLGYAIGLFSRPITYYFDGAGPLTSDLAAIQNTWKNWLGYAYFSYDAGSVYRVDPNLQPPMTWEANIGFERELYKGIVFRANYIHKKMDKLFYQERQNNYQWINGQWQRPDPNKESIFLLTNAGNMTANDFEFVLTKNFKGGSFLNLSYVHENTTGNSSRSFAFWFESYFNQTADQKQFIQFKAPADFEVKNYFKASWLFKLPLDILFSGFFQYRTGKPYTVYLTENYPQEWIVPEGINSRRLPYYQTLDVRLAKRVVIGKNRLQFYLDFFNLLNRDNVLTVEGGLLYPNFNVPQSYDRPRQAQFGIKWEFN